MTDATAASPATDPAAARAADLAALGDYVRLLADRMGLKDWTFGVEYERVGMTEGIDGEGKFGAISVGAGFFGMSPEDRRYQLVRYMILCHLLPARRLAMFNLGPDDWRDFKDALAAGMDAAAAAWAPALPLPLVGLMRLAGGAGRSR